MNFSPFGGHFASTIPIHQYTATKFNHESNNVINGISSQNASVISEEPMLSPESRYVTHYTQHSMPIKYQRDSSTQIGGSVVPVSSPAPQQPENIHHYAVYNHSEQDKRSQYHENMHPQDIKSEDKEETGQNDYTSIGQQQQPGMPPTWQSIAAPGSTVADYLSHLPASTLPISLHHFLKYSTETTSNKRDVETSMDTPLDQPQPQQHEQQNHIQHEDNHSHEEPMSPSKRRKKKKTVKEKKPRPKPGEIRLTTALDGSTLYCCPECHMAYPDKGLLEQHLLGHTMERRFFCDICGAGLKRKDHLTRHKQSHNPDRPFVCTVCMKAFKRKEQLTLHFVIHSGEKRHICTECGKGFYRKDHLRKHTRSHIARRVKAEMSQHVPTQAPRGDHS